MDQNTQLPQQVCIKQKFAIGKEGEKKVPFRFSNCLSMRCCTVFENRRKRLIQLCELSLHFEIVENAKIEKFK